METESTPTSAAEAIAPISTSREQSPVPSDARPPEIAPIAHAVAPHAPAAPTEPASVAPPSEIAASHAAPTEAILPETVATEAVAMTAAPTESVATDVAPAATAPRALGIDPAVEARRVRAEENWQRVRAAKESGETLTGVVTGTTNGGLLVDLAGVRGFLPASQTSVEPGAALDSLLKKKIPLKIIDVDDKRRRIVASHRRALESTRHAKRAEFLKSLALDQVHEGIVRRLADFGAFVDIGGIDGLVPMSELAFERVEKVSDILAIGDKLQVTILRIEENGRKIALSRKNALPDPWRDHPEVVRQGATVEGKVVSKEVGKDAGLRVELAPGIVGSIRDSDADPNDYEIGESIEVVIRYADRRNRRIKLGTVLGDDVKVSSSGGFAPLGLELAKKR